MRPYLSFTVIYVIFCSDTFRIWQGFLSGEIMGLCKVSQSNDSSMTTVGP